MRKVDIEKVRRICEQELSDAVIQLRSGDLPHSDMQYHLGRKHAAMDILKAVNLLEVGG